MSKKKQQIPAIRFNGFTNAWEQRKLGYDKDVRDGTHDSPKYHQEGHPLVTSKNLNDYGLDMTDVSLISNSDFEAINKRSKVDNGDILFGMIGTIGNPVIVDRSDFAIKNVALIKEGGDIPNRFLIQLLKSSVFEKYIRNENAGNTQKFLGLSKIREFTFFTPTTEEQIRIATFFKQLDDTVALHQRQLDNYKQLKQILMKKIFNQEIQFKDNSGNDYPVWEKKKLKDLGKFYSGTGFNDKYQGYLDLSIPFFKVSDMNISSNSKYMVESNNTVDDDICREMKINKIKGPAILFAKVGAAIYKERKRIVHNAFLMDNNMMALAINNSVDIEFAYYLCQSLNFSKYAQIGALPSYNASDIGSLNCKLPTIPEQEKIAIFLSTVDQKVNQAEQKVELLKEQKRGLMQLMFI